MANAGGKPLARWKTLVMDVVGDDVTSTNFWAEALGGSMQGDMRDGAPDVEVDDGRSGLGIATELVGDEPSMKNHVHLDVFTDSVETLLQLGAKPHESGETPEGLPWTVMRDPDGKEFCAFVRDPAPAYRLHAVVLDSLDPEASARWWGRVFGAEPLDHEDHWTLEGVHPGEGVTLDFVKVPELTEGKDPLHFDVFGDADAIRELGAAKVVEQPGWMVMRDPDGHEFCVHRDPRASSAGDA